MLNRNYFRLFIGIFMVIVAFVDTFVWAADYPGWSLPKLFPATVITFNYQAKPINPAQFKPLRLRPRIVYTNWTKGYDRQLNNQNQYNLAIALGLTKWPGLDPLVFKSILIQESSMVSIRKNKYGYAGVAQLGRKEAVSCGLVVRGKRDDRYNHHKSIRASVMVLRQKALYLEQGPFKQYGRPKGDEYWKFIAAAYNAGEGTISQAMKYAYGNRKPRQVKFSDLVAGRNINNTALYKAIPWWWDRKAKYQEISQYAQNVLLRARQ